MPQADYSNLTRFLDRLTRRSVLSKQEQEAILSLPGHAAQVQANREFVHHGQRVSHASLVVDGIVGRLSQSSEGTRQITAMHIPGDMADLHSLVQPEGTSALRALSTATILRVPHSALRTVAGHYPAVAEAFWRDCMVDASILSQWVVNVGRRDAQTRMAHLLCEMASRHGVRNADQVIFQFRVTQAQLADALALTAVHVNRTLMKLRADNLVTFSGRVVRILKWTALVNIGEFDGDYLQEDAELEQRVRLTPLSWSTSFPSFEELP